MCCTFGAAPAQPKKVHSQSQPSPLNPQHCFSEPESVLKWAKKKEEKGNIFFLCIFFWPQFYPEFLQYYTMILQRPRIIVGDAGFEPRTTASEVWRATNETPHLLISETTKIKVAFSEKFHFLG